MPAKFVARHPNRTHLTGISRALPSPLLPSALSPSSLSPSPFFPLPFCPLPLLLISYNAGDHEHRRILGSHFQ